MIGVYQTRRVAVHNADEHFSFQLSHILGHRTQCEKSQMVHLRINERESRPNEYINWITALPMPDAQPPNSEEDARHLLRALAAQVRPVMKKHGITVNSLEEVLSSSEWHPIS